MIVKQNRKTKNNGKTNTNTKRGDFTALAKRKDHYTA